MTYTYRTQGVCSSSVEFELREGRVYNASFEHGCDGNLKGICSLIEGMPAEEVIDRLQGIRCEWKDTSCPDQLARILTQALQETSLELSVKG